MFAVSPSTQVSSSEDDDFQPAKSRKKTPRAKAPEAEEVNGKKRKKPKELPSSGDDSDDMRLVKKTNPKKKGAPKKKIGVIFDSGEN